MKLCTMLNFGGNCREAFEFYERHLGGKITAMLTAGDMPAGSPGPGGFKDAIIHARMLLGEAELIGNDVPPDVFQPMRSVYLYLSVSSAEEAERVHAILSESGQIFMPMEQTFFASRFSMLRDRFGISWTVIHERPMQQPG